MGGVQRHQLAKSGVRHLRPEISLRLAMIVVFGVFCCVFGHFGPGS